MKKIYFLLVYASFAYGQVPNNTVGKNLDKNRVKARVHMVNNKFWDVYQTHKALYEVPRGKLTNAQFANSLWIGGYDKQGLLHVSANTYRQNGADFWPGPLDTTNISAFNSTYTAMYNQLWKVDCDDVSAFTTAFNNGSVTLGTYTVPADIANYPARGVNNFQKKLEPFYDANGDGLYDPGADGDYPIIKGHQQVLSIYNDNFTTHTETQGNAMGLEIHERSYAYSDPTLPDSMQAVNYSTFYHYTIYNRSNTDYVNVFISDWADFDLGYYLDDYVGTDTVNNFAYGYNGDNNDETVGNVHGYLTHPPVISHAILQTSYCTSDGIDNDHDGQIDEPGEQFLLDRSTYYLNNIGAVPIYMNNPDSAIHYYRYMSGFWKDGVPFTQGGTGRGGTIPSKHVFTGNPATNSGWTESSAGIVPGDARILYGSGPFNFAAHSKIEWGYAIVFSQDTTQAVNTITQFNTRVQRDVRNVKYYDQVHQAPQCLSAIYTGLQETNGPVLKALVYPNPAWNKVSIQLSDNVKEADIKMMDVSGRTIIQKSIRETSSVNLDLQDLESGIYFIEINTGNSKAVQKLVKSR